MIEAGRELDALVAEKVMGWIWIEGDDDDPRALVSPDETCSAAWYPSVGNAGVGSHPDFSTSIADAWKVAEELCVLEWGFSLFKYPGLSSMGFGYVAVFAKSLRPYSVEIVNLGDPSKVAHGHSDNAAHAICLAALRALEAVK